MPGVRGTARNGIDNSPPASIAANLKTLGHLTEKLQEREGLSVGWEFVRRVRLAFGLAARRPPA